MNISERSVSGVMAAQKERYVSQAGLLLLLITLGLMIGHFKPVQHDILWSADQVLLLKSNDQPVSGLPDTNSGSWHMLNIGDIGKVDGAAWIRTEVKLPGGSGPIPPYALFLAGPFSAGAYWDGTALGSKGSVGTTPAEESPGPIDAVFYIPELLSGPGTHELLIHISSQNIGYQPHILFHNLYVSSYQNDPRRQLRFYALPLILSGCLVLFMLHFWRVFHSSGSQSAFLLGLLSMFLIMQMALEVSRSLVAYSYDWHFYRSLGIWFCAFGCGLALTRLSLHRHGQKSRAILWVVLVFGLAVSYLVNGFDNKAVAALLVCSIIPIVLGIRNWAGDKPDLLLFAGGILGLAWMVSAAISVAGFLDSTVYFTSVTYLGMTWLWTSRGRETFESLPEPANKPAHFVVRHTGRTERIKAELIVLVSAAGNFAELVCKDGSTVLHHLRLGQIMENPPAGFVRVHRSYAVNLKHVQSLKSREGSRYSLLMEGEHEVPVSRYRVSELRKTLAHE